MFPHGTASSNPTILTVRKRNLELSCQYVTQWPAVGGQHKPARAIHDAARAIDDAAGGIDVDARAIDSAASRDDNATGRDDNAAGRDDNAAGRDGNAASRDDNAAGRDDSTDREHRNAVVLQVQDVLRVTADYVRAECDGDAELLTTSGYPLAKQPEPYTEVGIPTNVRASATDVSGEVKLIWGRTLAARMFRIEQAESDPVWGLSHGPPSGR